MSRRGRLVGLGLALLSAWWLAVPAGAGETPTRAEIQRSALERWKGRSCTPASCRDRNASPVQTATGFAAAALAIAWAARREPGPRPA